MTEVVWVALISSGSALFIALVTQYLAAKATHKQSTHRAQQEALQWQRSVAIERREQKQKALGDLWIHALNARSRMVDSLVSSREKNYSARFPELAESATGAASEAYAIALVSLPPLRSAAKALHDSAYQVEEVLHFLSAEEREKRIPEVTRNWSMALNQLERAVSAEADALLAETPH